MCRADHSSRGVLANVVCLSVALDHWRLLRHGGWEGANRLVFPAVLLHDDFYFSICE